MDTLTISCTRCLGSGFSDSGGNCSLCCGHGYTVHAATDLPSAPNKIKSDGGASDYYKLPPGASELRHLIQAKNMNFAVGNIFKACYRLGEKEGTDHLYDVRKVVFFGLDELERASGPAYAEELRALKTHILKELDRIGSLSPS